VKAWQNGNNERKKRKRRGGISENNGGISVSAAKAASKA
jgi:hypothetical protein